MRAASEAWLARTYPQVLAQIGGSLSLTTYTLARYLHSEVGSGTVEERVAVAESAVNRARRERLSKGVLGLLLYRKPLGHPNRGYYGPIHGIGTGTSTAPYGRWAATSRDPSIMSLLLAHLVASGASGDFAQGADDQDGPEAWISKGQTSLHNYVRGLAAKGKFWVGPLAGVDHWHTFLQFTPDPLTRATMGKQLTERGIEALTLPRKAPTWNTMALTTCGKPIVSRRAASFLVASAGLAAGGLLAHFFARRYVATP
jgi:hypothetical protein